MSPNQSHRPRGRIGVAYTFALCADDEMVMYADVQSLARLDNLPVTSMS